MDPVTYFPLRKATLPPPGAAHRSMACWMASVLRDVPSGTAPKSATQNTVSGMCSPCAPTRFTHSGSPAAALGAAQAKRRKETHRERFMDDVIVPPRSEERRVG